MQYGNTIETNILKSDTSTVAPNQGHVDIFFENIAPSRKYRQIGLVEAKGGIHDSEAYILARLKWQAWQAGADALIQIRKSSQNRETGFLFTDDDKKVYDASVYTGVAVAYLDTTANSREVDSVLVRDTTKKIKDENSVDGAVIFIALILGLVIGVIANADKM